MVPSSWSPDSRYLLLHTTGAANMWVLPLEGDRKLGLLLGTPFDEGDGAFSPDGHWVAYTSNETGRAEVYVRPFLLQGPDGKPALGQGKWQISRDGGRRPHWTTNDRIVFEASRGIMAADTKTKGDALQAGTPRLRFRPSANAGWDVTRDGKRFLFSTPQASKDAQPPINVAMNWPELLKR
jgi:Tol biopolymer transport system component